MPDKSTTERRSALPPYSLDEVDGYFTSAWAQPTAEARDALLALLCLGLGVGASPKVLMTHLPGTSVAELQGYVCVLVQAGGIRTCLPCLKRYGPLLLEVGERAGRNHLLGSYRNGVNATGDVARIVTDPSLPRLTIYRLMSTYRSELADMLHLAVLAQQLGTYDLDNVADLVRHLPPPSFEESAPILCGSRDDDGPWRPDWATRRRSR